MNTAVGLIPHGTNPSYRPTAVDSPCVCVIMKRLCTDIQPLAFPLLLYPSHHLPIDQPHRVFP